MWLQKLHTVYPHKDGNQGVTVGMRKRHPHEPFSFMKEDFSLPEVFSVAKRPFTMLS